MRNNFQKFLTSEYPPHGNKGIFAKTWKYAACMLLAFILGVGNAWGAETEIIKSVLSGSNGSTQTVTGSIGGTSAVSNLGSSSPYKLNSSGAYVSITLASGYFQATDFLELDGSKAMQVYYGTPTSGTLLLTTTGPTDGKIRVKLKGLPANQNTIYVYRSSSTYNGTLTYMSVKRPDPLPTTGTGTVTYSLISNSANVEGETTVSTIAADDVSFTTSNLTVTSENSKTGYSGQIKGFTAISEYNASYYVALSFSVASGYTFEPSAASLTIFANSCTPNAKVVISDEETTIESNTLTCSSSKDAAITFAAGTFIAGKKFSGDVTIKVYFWGASGDKRAYIKSPIEITGTVATAAPATKRTVTIDPNGGSYASTPDGWTYDDVADKYTTSIASGTSFTAPAGLAKGTDDLTWKDGNENDVTFPVSITGDITFVAQWAPHAASSDATLSALSVAGCTLNETFDPATTAYTISLPFYGAMPAVGDVTATKNDPNADDPEVSISGNVITVHCVAENDTSEKDYTITVNIAAAPTASNSVNLEQNILDNSTKWDFATALAAAHITVSGTNGLDSLNDDPSKKNRNYAYLGLKLKKTADIIKIVVPADNVLNVKFGNVGVALTTTINGAAGPTVAKKTDGNSSTFHLDAVAYVREIVFHSPETQTVTLQQVKIGADVDPITLPWLVTYDAGEHGTCATAKETWKGTALTLPVVTPESGWNFEGWKDDEDNPVISPYTPTKNVTLTAQYSAQASPFDLTSLTYQIGTGAATNVGYTDGTYTYNIVLPYKASYDAITVTPVLKEATSYLKGDEVLTVSSLPGAATFTVVEAGGASEQLYTVNFTRAPKDGVCLIWGDVAKNSLTRNAAKSQYNGTLANTDVRDNTITLDELVGHKFQAGGYLSLALEGQDFKAGDQVAIFVTSLNGLTDKLRVYNKNEAKDANVVAISDENMTTGVNKATLAADASTIYLRRGDDYSSWNPCVAYVAVYRAMMPKLTAITINGRDGVIDPLDDKHFTVTIPNDANLASLTVEPTIVRNAPHATTPEQVMTNSGAWVLTADGDNTYRIMDKDGDYTDYTITLIRDVLKHTVSFNTHGGSAIDPVEVVDGQKLTAAPTDPTKEDYLFQGWSATDGGSIIDITDVTIDEPKTFHAVWAADGAIKLLDGATVNHTNFITGVTADETVEFKGNEVHYAKFAGKVSGVNGVKDLTRVIAYNATTNKTKIQISAHNNSTSARNILVKGLVEGASEAVDLATIALGNKEDKVSDWIEFDNAANRTIYIFVGSSAGDVYFTQVKVIESGETPMKMAGEAGYSLNFNKGRFFGVKDLTAHFEGLDVEVASSDCSPLNTEVVKLASTSMSFTVASDMTLSVTTANNKTYYVTEGAAGTDNETAKTGVSEFNLTAGTWYITAGSSEVQFTKIEFIAPKCQQPTVADMENIGLCEGDAFTALTVSASVTDGGMLHYQWYKHPAEGDDETVGTDEASYTPEADGQYYVVVTNQLADYSDNSKTSNMVTVEHFASAVITTAPLNQRATAGNKVTLSVAATGKNVAYKWYTCDEDGSNEVALDPEQTGTSIEVTITAGLLQWYKVKVTSDCGNAEAMAKVEEFVPATPANVTESIVWDWTSAAWPASGEVQFTDKTQDGTDLTPAYELLADADAIVPKNAAFRSDMLYGKGQYVWRSGNKFFQGTAIKFTTEVAGLVRVNYRSTGNNKEVQVTIAGTPAGKNKTSNFQWSDYVEVPAGDVEILCLSTDEQKSLTRVQKIEFLAVGHERTLVVGDLGTVCLPNASIARGVTVYEYQGADEIGKIVFDELGANELLVAGKPYIFQVNETNARFYYNTDPAVGTPDNSTALKGNLGATITFAPGSAEAANVYFVKDHAFWMAKNTGVKIGQYRCYLQMDEVQPVSSPNPAPGRRRITLGVQGEQVATGIDQVPSDQVPSDQVPSTKVIIDGHLYILRGEKMYDAKGQLVK